MDRRFFEILVNKPDLIADFPEWMFPTSIINEIKKTENVAIAEIAGRDSIASVILAHEKRPIQAVIPTIAYAGTEYGNWKTTFEKVDDLKDRLQKNNIKVFDPIVLGSPRFWWRLCGRYATHFFKSYGFYSHCVGCHLYFHAIRIPLAKKLDCNVVIGGERESHNGKIKINQIGIALDAYTSFLKRFGIELFLPLRYINSGKEIEGIIGQNWDEAEHQLECVLSKNYQEIDGSILFGEDAIRRFFDEFAFKKAEDTVRSYLTKRHPIKTHKE